MQPGSYHSRRNEPKSATNVKSTNHFSFKPSENLRSKLSFKIQLPNDPPRQRSAPPVMQTTSKPIVSRHDLIKGLSSLAAGVLLILLILFAIWRGTRKNETPKEGGSRKSKKEKDKGTVVEPPSNLDKPPLPPVVTPRDLAIYYGFVDPDEKEIQMEDLGDRSPQSPRGQGGWHEDDMEIQPLQRISTRS